MGSRVTWVITRFRISVMARWAATPSTWDSAKAVPAWITVAPSATPESHSSSSERPFGTTSSMM